MGLFVPYQLTVSATRLATMRGSPQALEDPPRLKASSGNDVVFVPAGSRHNLINTGLQDLRLFTVYAPPEHKDGTIHHRKADALADEHEHEHVAQ